MKTTLLISCFAIFAILQSSAQTDGLAPDQNPNYMASRAKYMQVADSINKWHATTIQSTYYAPDWYQRKVDSRNQRQAFRREMRLARARNNSNFYSPGYYQGYGYGNYNNNWNNGWRRADRWLSPIYDITLPLLLYNWWR